MVNSEHKYCMPWLFIQKLYIITAKVTTIYQTFQTDSVFRQGCQQKLIKIFSFKKGI